MIVLLWATILTAPAAVLADDDDGDDNGGGGNGCVTPPEFGMVSWWPGDGHFMDIVGGNHGAPIGGATANGPGMVQEAFTLDGLDDAVQAPETGASLDGFDELTLDAWVFSTRLANPPDTLRGIVTKYDSRSADGVSYYLTQVDGGFLRLAVFETVQPEAFATYTSLAPVVPLNEWVHVAGTWGGYGPTGFKLYVDGLEVPGILALVDDPAFRERDAGEHRSFRGVEFHGG